VAFRSIFIDGKISNPKTGRTVSLSLLGDGETNLPFLQSLKLTLVRNINMNMSIILTPPYEDAIALTSKDSEWLRLGNTVGVRWGYSDMDGMVSDWNYGFMQQPDVSYGEEITVTIEATTLAWNMDRVAKCRDWASTESPRTLLSIVVEIADRYGFEVEYAVISEYGREMFETEESSFVQGGRTDLQFLMYEVERRGARMIIQNNRMIIIDSTAPLPEYPDVNATFQIYGKIDIWNNMLPMDSFSSQSMGAMFLRNFQGTTVVPYGPNSDPEEAAEVARVSDADSTENTFSSDKTASTPTSDGNTPKDMGDIKVKATVAVDTDTEESSRNFTMPLNGEETEAFIKGQIEAVNNAAAEDHGITASFSAIAIPNLLPGMFVRLIGVGDYFSSVYMLNQIVLDIGPGRARMECECFGRGFPAIEESVDAMASDVKKSQEPSDGNITSLTESNVAPEEQ
jgi:hypothetical protein